MLVYELNSEIRHNDILLGILFDHGSGSSYRFRAIDIKQYAKSCGYTLNDQLDKWLKDGSITKVEAEPKEIKKVAHYHRKQTNQESPRDPKFIERRRSMLYEFVKTFDTISPMSVAEKLSEYPALYEMYGNHATLLLSHQVYKDMLYLSKTYGIEIKKRDSGEVRKKTWEERVRDSIDGKNRCKKLKTISSKGGEARKKKRQNQNENGF
ncbi:MAG: hypothetical protein V1870_01240 [Candidatus Aenigmatarchaeota archaeon]